MEILIMSVLILIIYMLLQIIITYIYTIKKHKNISEVYCIRRLNSAIIDSNIRFRNINTLSAIIIFSVIFFLITFLISYSYLKMITSSFILAVISAFIPYYILRVKIYKNKQKIIKMFPNYVINLKNYTDVNNDIVDAFKRADPEQPLKSYINKFNISIQKGINIYDAFESLKRDINIKSINEFINLLQFCYINGGNFTILLDKFCKIQMKINIQKEKERQEIFSSKLVLIILIVLNIYILFGFIFQKPEYFNILTKTFIGELILNINILSYIFILYIYTKLNKMEE